MKFNFKYTIIYVLLLLLLFWIVIYISNNDKTENFNNRINPIGYPKNALINYKDLNSPLYSHNVNLPINDPISCKNFCGPKSQCLITREQCTSDVDCKGCESLGYYMDTQMGAEIYPGSKKFANKKTL